jgi:MOSC domain-containing protein YiiM
VEGVVLELRFKERRSEMVAVEQLELVEGEGIRGDNYYGLPRQVLLLDKSTLDEFGYKPGELREQILVNLPGLQGLPIGARLAIGSAEVEIIMDCAPCLTMAGYLGEDGPSFVKKIMGKRGMLAKVTQSGFARVGDAVALVGERIGEEVAGS